MSSCKVIVMQFLKAVRVDYPNQLCIPELFDLGKMPKIYCFREKHLEAATAGTVLSFNEGRKAYKGALKVLASSKG